MSRKAQLIALLKYIISKKATISKNIFEIDEKARYNIRNCCFDLYKTGMSYLLQKF